MLIAPAPEASPSPPCRFWVDGFSSPSSLRRRVPSSSCSRLFLACCSQASAVCSAQSEAKGGSFLRRVAASLAVQGGSVIMLVDLLEDNVLRIRVQDTGIGLTSEGMSRIFKARRAPHAEAPAAQQAL